MVELPQCSTLRRARLTATLLLASLSGCGLLATDCGATVEGVARPDGQRADGGDALDRGWVDAATNDAMLTDALPPDAPSDDAPSPEASLADVSLPDVSLPDVSLPDGTSSDQSMPDTALPDSTSPDVTIGPAAPCGTVSTVADDFTVAGAASYWEVSSASAMTTEEIGGELVMTLAAGRPGASYASYTAVYAVYLVDDALSAEVVSAPNPSSQAQAGLEFASVSGDHAFMFFVENGVLTSRYWVSNQHNDLSVSYHPTDHRWWRISEALGQISFEVSPDGDSWDTIRTVAPPAEALLGYPSLWAGTWRAEANPGEVRFGDVCASGPARSWCPAERVQDVFEDGILAPVWWIDGSAGYSVIETGGELRVETGNVDGFECGAFTRSGYTLAQGAITFEITERSSHPAVQTGLLLWGPDDLYLEFGLLGSTVFAYVEPSELSQDVPNQGWSWLRLSQAGTILSFEASADGVIWSPLYNIDAGMEFELFEMGLGLGHQTWVNRSGLEERVSARFDNFNTAPAR